jgi:hypothetical protein
MKGQRHQRFTGDLDLPVLGDALELDAHAGLALMVELFHHPPTAAHGVSQLRDVLKTHIETPQLGLRRPLRQQAAQPGHAQHALGEDIGPAGAAREVQVDVDRVVVARCAGEERQHAAVHRWQLQWRQFIADLHGVETRVVQGLALNAGRPAPSEARPPVHHAGWWRGKS